MKIIAIAVFVLFITLTLAVSAFAGEQKSPLEPKVRCGSQSDQVQVERCLAPQKSEEWKKFFFITPEGYKKECVVGKYPHPPQASAWLPQCPDPERVKLFPVVEVTSPEKFIDDSRKRRKLIEEMIERMSK